MAVFENQSDDKVQAIRNQRILLGMMSDVPDTYFRLMTYKQRVAFWLRYEHGLRYCEIAAALGISQGSAKKRVIGGERNYIQAMQQEDRCGY